MPMLSIYNTLSKKKEIFEPINPPEVKMYMCGPTVYDYFHVGNARSFIMADVVRRYLEYSGYKVKFVMNLTDVDDKIIKKSIAEKISCHFHMTICGSKKNHIRYNFHICE